MSKKKTQRLNLDLSVDARERLERLKEMADTSTLTDVVKKSLILYELILQCQQEGGTLILRALDGTEQNLLLV